MTAAIAGTEEQTRPGPEVGPATGVWNQSGFLAAARPVFDLCRRLRRPVALVMLEVRPTTAPDGNGRRDEILAHAVANRFRSTDVLGLVAHNRLAALLPDCASAAMAIPEGVQVLQAPTPTDPGMALAVGVVHRATAEGTLEELLDDADDRLATFAPPAGGPEADESRPWRTVGHGRRTRTRARVRKR
jgi:hypothetical protein